MFTIAILLQVNKIKVFFAHNISTNTNTIIIIMKFKNKYECSMILLNSLIDDLRCIKSPEIVSKKFYSTAIIVVVIVTDSILERWF